MSHVEMIWALDWKLIVSFQRNANMFVLLGCARDHSSQSQLLSVGSIHSSIVTESRAVLLNPEAETRKWRMVKLLMEETLGGLIGYYHSIVGPK